MDQPDFQSQSKNPPERATVVSSNKSASRHHGCATVLLKSGLGFSEPTGLPSAELSSTQSVRGTGLLERKQANG